MTDIHYGNDQMGAPTTHKGDRANCPAPECQDAEIAAAGERAVTPALTEEQRDYLEMNPRKPAPPITLPPLPLPGNRYTLDWPGDYCCSSSNCSHGTDDYVPDDVLTVTCADCRPGGVEGDPIHVGDIEQGDDALAELLRMIATHETEAKVWHDEAAAATKTVDPETVVCRDGQGNEYPEHDYDVLECRRCGAETPIEG